MMRSAILPEKRGGSEYVSRMVLSAVARSQAWFSETVSSMGMVVFGGGCYEMNLWLAMEARLDRVSSIDCGFGPLALGCKENQRK
jgi:hypothetical protein